MSNRDYLNREALLSSTAGDAAAIIAAALAAAEPVRLEPDPAVSVHTVVVPDGASLERIDLEHLLPGPRRRKGTYRPATVDAFADYVERFEEPRSSVWVHPTSGRVVAVLNDHLPRDAAGDGVEPGWRDHLAELKLAHTPEWLYWTGQDGNTLSQEAFAEHIEAGAAEIVEPDAATMLEIAQTFHASIGGTFRSSTRLSSGEQRLQWDEEVQASAGKTAGELAVPTEIVLAVAPFVGEEPYRVTARLRFRVRSGTLSLGYRLDRPDAVVRDALKGVHDRLADRFANVYLGEPPA